MRRVAFVINREKNRQTLEALAAGVRLMGDQAEVYTSPPPPEEYDILATINGRYENDRMHKQALEAGKQFLYINASHLTKKVFLGKELEPQYRYMRRFFLNRYWMESIEERPPDRWERLGIQLLPWKKGGRHVLLAGVDHHEIRRFGIESVDAWREEAYKAITAVTDRPIIYRPKPARVGYPIRTKLSFAKIDNNPHIPSVLDDVFVIVSHSGGMPVDGFAYGIPSVILGNHSAKMLATPIESLESPRYPEEREAWFHSLAYTEFTMAEQEDGTAYRMSVLDRHTDQGQVDGAEPVAGPIG